MNSDIESKIDQALEPLKKYSLSIAFERKVAEAKAILLETVKEGQADILIWATGGIKEFTDEGKIVIPEKIRELQTQQEEK